MGIIDDYLSEDAVKTATTPAAGSGLIQQYLDADEAPRKKVYIDTTPKPPISGVSKERSDEINAQPGIQGGRNPRDEASLLGNAGSAIYEGGKSGILEAGSGLGDMLSNKPASGVGKIGMGALSILASPIEGVSSIVKDVTGNKEAGDKAALLVGSALPVVPTVGAISKALPKNKALSELVEAITSEGRDPQALVNTVKAMKADPRIGPADTSPAVLSMTQKLFTTEGSAAKNYLHNTSSNRMATVGDDVTKAFDEAGGTPVHVINKLNELSTASKKVGNNIINPALAGSKPVNISSTLSALDDILKPGVLKIGDSVPLTAVKKELEDIRASLRTSKEYDASDLHSFQSGLRKTAERLLKSATGNDKEVGQALMNVRNNLVNDIDKVSPKIKIIEDGVEKEVGAYRHGLNSYREEMHIADAFKNAYGSVFSNSTKMENMPEFTEKWFKGLTDHEKEAAIEGARLAIKSKMGVSGNPSLAGTNLGKSEFNQKKLEILFGKEETEKLLRDLDNTRAIKNTHNKLIENSQTAMRLAGDKAVALPVKPETNPLNKYVIPGIATAAEFATGGTGAGVAATLAIAGASKVGSYVKHEIATKIAKERNLQIAKYALPTEGPSRDQLIKSLEAAIPGPKQSLLTRGANSLSRLVAP